MKIRVGGVYNHDTVIQLLKNGINDFSFDLRPRSFNFIQLYKVIEILDNTDDDVSCSFHFEDEKDFVVHSLLDQVKGAFKPNHTVQLEFSGKESMLVHDQYKIPFTLHYNEFQNIDEVAKCEFLDTISIDHDYLERLNQFNGMHDFLGKLYDVKKENQTIEISANWNSPIMEVLLDFYDISSLAFEIAPQVELSYRNINLPLITGHIEQTKRMLSI